MLAPSRRSLTALLIAFATSSLGLSACADRSCTLVGCVSEPVTVVLLSPNWMPLEPAVYELAFELNGARYTTTCSATPAEQSCDSVAGEPQDFGVSVFVTTNNQIRINVTSDTPDLLPDDFRVEVSVAGSLVVEESGAFEYDESQPNGPGCEPTCRSSDGAFVFVEL